MTTSREHYQVAAADLEGLKRELNFILARIEDRLDQIEGRRGTATVIEKLDITDADGNVIGGFSND